ncbi:MAG: hypothetical protein Q9217_006472, partial [Psora testacea]
LAEADLAAQARQTAASAAKTIQTGTKGAAEKLNNFIENEGAGPSARSKPAVAPERQDFWDSFGDARAENKGNAIGTAAMRKGGGGGAGGKEDGWDNWEALRQGINDIGIPYFKNRDALAKFQTRNGDGRFGNCKDTEPLPSFAMVPKILSLLSRLADELGVYSVLRSSRDTKLLCLQRFTRLFAYGASTLVLALYLASLGTSDARIGLFMTLTLLGDVVISFLLALVADGLGRRRILVLGAGLMTASGIIFAISGNYWVLVAASILGVISPSGNEIGPFKAIEESTLAQLTPIEIRNDIFAWYTLLGSAGTATGTIACGWIVQGLLYGGTWSEIGAYRVIFGIYAALGLVKLGLSVILSDQCEPAPPPQQYQEVVEMVDADAERLLSDSEDDSDEQRKTKGTKTPKPTLGVKKSIWPAISKESRSTLAKLCILFSVDSLASGLVPLSWITYFFSRKFKLPEGQLGTLFFVTNIIASIGTLAASSLAKRIGLIKTMVLTHLPSAIFLAMIPLPSHAWLAMTFLIIRSSMQSMDQAPRQAFLAAAVLPSERTAVMGVVNVVKTLSQSGGPITTGFLAGIGKFWISFLIAGGMKVSYDLGMLKMFLGYKSREDEEEGAGRKKEAARAHGQP